MSMKNVLRLAAGARQFSQTAVRSNNVHPGYAKIKQIQARFQKPDGLPVHLKGGVTDRALFGVTVVLCVIGVGWIAETIFVLANPRKLE